MNQSDKQLLVMGGLLGLAGVMIWTEKNRSDKKKDGAAATGAPPHLRPRRRRPPPLPVGAQVEPANEPDRRRRRKRGKRVRRGAMGKAR